MTRIPAFSIFALCLICLCLWSCSSNKKKENKPNILVLISDDQRWDQVSYPGNQIFPEFQTPNLDKLASEGVYFTNAFVTTPICAVSRACIMTGRYASSHGMNHFNTPINDDVLMNTYPALLKEAGYRTGVIGKWGMGMAGTEKIFDVCNAWHNQGSYFHNTDSGRIHNSEWLASEAHKFFKSGDTDQPFCLTVCYKSPHHPYQPDPRDSLLFEDIDIPKRIADTPEEYEDMAAHIMDSSLNRWCYFDERGTEAIKNDFEKNFLRCVMSLDRSVGKVMQSLETLGLDKNTIVIFLSDHGYLWGEHGLGGKWILYEESIRIPVIIKWPEGLKKKKGQLLPQQVLSIDLAPTILEMAGIEVPAVVNGKSLIPVLKGSDDEIRDEFFMEHVDVIKVKTPIPDSYGIRSRDWKYIRYVNNDPVVEEIYNMKTDPFEMNNLANDPGSAEAQKNLRKLCDDYITELNNL